MNRRDWKAAALAAGMLAAMMTSPVDARRGGSFGSRGSRTYAAPRSTSVAPGYTPGLSRSMTPRQAQAGSAFNRPYGGGYASAGPPRFGFGGGLLAGVVAGGLLGSLLGHGSGSSYGGGSVGMLATLIQLAILGGIAWFVIGLFRRRVPATPSFASSYAADRSSGTFGSAVPIYAAPPAESAGADIAVTPSDQQAFERLLGELQDAFGHEDYARLRAITTPEIMSYLAEELSDNATHGRRNDVTGTRLLDAEVSEAWQENGSDYATVAMNYESADVMRDRTSGAVLSGDPSRPTVTTELWTFVRSSSAWSEWKVSAVQEA